MPAASVAHQMTMRFLPVREDCFLVELAGLAEALDLYEAVQKALVPGVREIIPAARTLLIQFDPHEVSGPSLKLALASLGAGQAATPSPVLVEIPVHYDGEDLVEVADMLGMTAEEVVKLHTESEFLVAFTGFAPGFAYLAGGDPRLAVPRRKSPRTHVPAGSVGLAGEFSGVYPKASPGGWQLIGTTPLAMFDIDRAPAALLQPGYRVRFRDLAKGNAYMVAPATKVAPVKQRNSERKEGAAAIEVISVGLPVLFQDLGRIGQTTQGISRSGAADRLSLKTANRLVGNKAGSAALEVTLGHFRFRMRGKGVMAVTGAPAPLRIKTADGEELVAAHATAIALNDGDVVSLGAPPTGMRSYLAFRGGFNVEPVLGSFATDTLAQIGPPPLLPGETVALCSAPVGALVSEDEQQDQLLPKAGDDVVLDVVMGPRTDWFTDASVSSFLSQPWLATVRSSRVGIRLQGEALERSIVDELPSEATVHGAIQVPANGQPVLFLADHPLTGGYPVIANVAAHHLDLAGQIPPGVRIRFHPVSHFADSTSSGNHA